MRLSLSQNGKVIDRDSFHRAGYSIVKALQDLRVKHAELVVDVDATKVDSDDLARAFLRSAHGASYAFARHITRENKRPHIVETLQVTSKSWESAFNGSSSSFSSSAKDAVDETRQFHATVDATRVARDLANEREEIVSCQGFEDVVRELCTRYPETLRMEVIRGDELLDRNLEMLHAVGRASRHAPRLVLLHYNQKGHAADTTERRADVAVVGKGIVFDSGESRCARLAANSQ